MQLILDVLLTALSSFVIGTHAVVGKSHFKSREMPPGANLVAVAVLLALAVYLLLLWTHESPLAAQLFGLGAGLVSLWLFHRTVAASRDGALHFAFDVEHPVSLVTAGPYRLVRHPFYASYLLFWTGMAISTWSLWAIPVLLLIVGMYTLAARDEERKFSNSSMAAEYAAYRSRTGMFLPRLAGK